MYNILVVDDEKFIRAGIINILEGAFAGSLTILPARNGEEAISVYNEKNIDILITDIRMPKINGIELIKYVRENNKNSKIVVLSGFADFEYAQQCIEFAVSNYILKPIDTDKFIEIIKTIITALDNNKTADENMTKSRGNRLKKYIMETLHDEGGLHEYFDKINMNFEKYYIYVTRDMESFSRIADNSTINFNVDGYSVIFSGSAVQQTDLSEFSKNEFVGFGEIKKNRLAESKRIITELVKYGFLYKNGLILHNELANRLGKTVDMEKIHDLINAAAKNEQNLLNNILDELFAEKELNRYRYEYFIDLINNINKYLQEGSIFNDIESGGQINSLQKLIEEMRKKLSALSVFMNQSNKMERQYVEAAKTFIGRNYKTDLTMAMVANHIDINYSYFSAIFKRGVGMNFPDYLNHVRIEAAKKLLSNVELKIYEISEMVGYGNPKHFMKMFRKYEGISPTQYKMVALNKKLEDK